ncbi:MAG: hypothetical protein NTY70_17630, partial [Burkholderiales bacterium]|nr:hypothetical protein [Burkholderiales bacterium]
KWGAGFAHTSLINYHAATHKFYLDLSNIQDKIISIAMHNFLCTTVSTSLQHLLGEFHVFST